MADPRPISGIATSVAASALRAQQARMRIISENLANAGSISPIPGGDPYRRRSPVFAPSKVDGGLGVKMVRVQPDMSDFKTEYDPGAPAADANGYVKTPNVDPMVEAMDMRDAQRAYEANLNVIETARNMSMRTLDLLKK